MPKIHLIIWSKNRAAQLECLLDSILQYLPDLFVVSVLYKNSGQEFKLAYDILLERENELFDYSNSTIIEENNFYQDTIRLIKDKGTDLVCLCTDDTVFFRKPENVSYEFFSQELNEDTATFSLRLGLNTVLQHCFTGMMQPPLKGYTTTIDKEYLLSWNFRDYHPLMNYGYPCGLDGHIYRRDVLESIINFNFNNTNELEGGMFRNQNLFPPLMKSFNHSLAVNVPKNNLSGVTMSEGACIGSMNAKFLSGKRLRLKGGQNVIGSHQLLEMVWV